MLDEIPANPGTALEWLRHAESDRRLAASRQEGVILELFCFHAQQAVEKAFKALLVHLGIEVPRTHNIGHLLDLLESHYEIPEHFLEAARLTLYSVETRYPAFSEPVRDAEYRDAIRIADEVVRWVRNALGAE